VVGFLTGLLGVGGGFLIIPVLVLALGLPMTTAVGTSLVVVAINSAAGFAAHVDEVRLDIPITTTFTAAAVVASLAGSRLGAGADNAVLRRWFAWVTLAVAALIAGQLTADLFA
jgi:uncharacterized membrane protein YfcA